MSDLFESILTVITDYGSILIDFVLSFFESAFDIIGSNPLLGVLLIFIGIKLFGKIKSAK